MTSPTLPAEKFLGIAQRSADATSAAVSTWIEVLESYASSITAEHPLPRTSDVRTALGAGYDLAIALLTEQRALVTTTLDAGAKAASMVGEQVRTVAAAVPFRASDIMSPRGAAA